MQNLRGIYFMGASESMFLVDDAMTPLVTCHTTEDLASAQGKFKETGYSLLPVVDDKQPNRLLGYIQHADLMQAYKDEVQHKHFKEE